MPERATTRQLASTLVWSELRGLGWRLFVFPVGIGLLFLSVLALPADLVGSLDPQSVEVLQTQAGAYFDDVEGGRALTLALFFVQGPFLIAMFAAILAVLVVQTGLGKRLQEGELELLLSGPYSPNQVFLALVLGSVGLTLLSVSALAVLVLGGGAVLLLTSGVGFGGGVLTLVALTVLLPVPLAMWATLVAILVYLRWPETTANGMGPGNFLILLAIAPAITAVVGINAVPSLDPVLGALGLLALTTVALGVGFVSIQRWFRVDRVL